MTLIKNLIIALVGIALALGLYVAVKHSGLIQPLGQKEEDTATTTPSIVEEKAHSITYRNNTYGIAFQYPERYVMEENSAVDGNGYSMHWITLFRSQDFPLPQNGERPPEITITIIEMKGQSLFEWLKKGNSNYSPEDGMSSALASTTVSGVEAVHYTWSVYPLPIFRPKRSTWPYTAISYNRSRRTNDGTLDTGEGESRRAGRFDKDRKSTRLNSSHSS